MTVATRTASVVIGLLLAGTVGAATASTAHRHHLQPPTHEQQVQACLARHAKDTAHQTYWNLYCRGAIVTNMPLMTP